ncbi:MAG: hypothetical protein FWG80_04915 [Alphaproteobacteria bacterium]|nr:hypothetical protein [Alphaproteobacteria bacterium]
MSLRVTKWRGNLSGHSVSLRVASPLAVTDEAIFPGNGILILPLLEKIASWSLTTRNDTKCYKRLLLGL